jgi:hypothetical protein
MSNSQTMGFARSSLTHGYSNLTLIQGQGKEFFSYRYGDLCRTGFNKNFVLKTEIIFFNKFLYSDSWLTSTVFAILKTRARKQKFRQKPVYVTFSNHGLCSFLTYPWLFKFDPYSGSRQRIFQLSVWRSLSNWLQQKNFVLRTEIQLAKFILQQH